MTKRVAIVGAGCTGLGAIKCCLDEDLEPTCFESASDIGGLWRFTDDITDCRGSVMSSTVINTSKEMMAFSDFPPPREFPNFMHHSKVLEYFRLYANKFKLLQHIQFNTEVLSIQQQGRTSTDKTNVHEGYFRDKGNVYNASECSTWENSRRFGTNTNSHNKTNINMQHVIDGKNQKYKQKDNTPCFSLKSKSSHNVGQTKEKPELSQSGQWEITIKDKRTNEIRAQIFDCVLICTGHHADVSMPYFPGQSIFKGRIIHSRDLRRANEVAGSRHVVVGVGNSGCDVAVELSRHGQVYLSTRRGVWLMQRLQKYGLPADVSYMSRLIFAIALKLPTWMLNKFAELHLNKTVDHSLYSLRPKHGPFSTHPTVNDELPNRIASGHVVVKSNIESFTDTGVRFEDGTLVDDVDTVIMATGYKIDFPFLDQSILTVKGNQCPLYLYMFPPTVTPPTLAVIGCIQAGGAVVPVSEMQCRLATRVFKDEAQLPLQQEMQRDVVVNRIAMEKRYIQTQRHTIQVDFLPYMDQLASIVGCKPRLGKLLFKDPRLALTCIFGPCTSYQYRLMGPGARPGTRDIIMTQMERVRFPFRTRPIDDQSSYMQLGNMTVLNTVCLSMFVLAAVIFIHYFTCF